MVREEPFRISWRGKGGAERSGLLSDLNVKMVLEYGVEGVIGVWMWTHRLAPCKVDHMSVCACH